MKKSFVLLLLVLAVIVLVSPRIVGRLAEQSMDENLNWATTETEELSITSLGFDRGWFSSEGQHRLEIRDGELRDSLLALVDDPGGSDLPVLIIDTHIDHGLVPVSSIGREKGSLAPGLGSAVSTLRLEFDSGETVDLPGTIYSKVGLTGELESNLVVMPGTLEIDNESAHWGNVDVVVTTNPSTNAVAFSGTIDDLAFVSASNEVGIGGISFDGEHEQTRFGFGVGDAELRIDKVSFPSEFGQSDTGPWRVASAASLVDGLVSARTSIDTEYVPFGELGPAAAGLEISFEGLDAGAVSRISETIDNFDSYGSGDMLMLAVEDDLRKLLATGLSMQIERLDLAMSAGKISATLDVDVAPTDVDRFVWASVFLALEAQLELSVPVELYDFLVTLDPQVSLAVGMGFLKQNGNVYEMEAALKDGLLTVNGAPMPIPLPGGN
ncbi:MAG: DUF945 family protein [Woeseiaceae bacterium]|nr:DUF945 family protein [Woeseiaceae bacterium]NIP20630.1 DUF945 family protein [Woeseiaceae bacterium]NIS89423.1 DUF945 family protein [Woeseiaceae bacterium]